VQGDEEPQTQRCRCGCDGEALGTKQEEIGPTLSTPLCILDVSTLIKIILLEFNSVGLSNNFSLPEVQ
jgi:hypothetical protein